MKTKLLSSANQKPALVNEKNNKRSKKVLLNPAKKLKTSKLSEEVEIKKLPHQQNQLPNEHKIPLFQHSDEEVDSIESEDEGSKEEEETEINNQDAAEHNDIKQHLKKANNYLPPTSEELNELLQTEQLFKSNFWKLQVMQ
jgi:hypothetical protein